MPCTVSREEAECYEKEANQKKFGVAELNERITEAVACELGKLIKKHAPKAELSGMSKKWLELHAEKDKKRKKAKRAN